MVAVLLKVADHTHRYAILFQSHLIEDTIWEGLKTLRTSAITVNFLILSTIHVLWMIMSS